jgi:hypothetical protein
MKEKGNESKIRDLGGKNLVPFQGFIESGLPTLTRQSHRDFPLILSA